MSFTRKIIDSARSGLNTVMDKVAVDDTPLTHVSEELLQRELERRVAARRAAPTSPMDNPSARMAGASAEARQQRAKLASERDARIQASRAQRERAARQAQEEAFRRVKEQAQRNTSSAGAGSQRASGGRSVGGFPFQRKDDRIAEYYKVLDLPYGASFEEVKKSYRQLMRKYHPDRHTGDPKKQKAANELSVRVTQAYNALEEHLKK